MVVGVVGIGDRTDLHILRNGLWWHKVRRRDTQTMSQLTLQPLLILFLQCQISNTLTRGENAWNRNRESMECQYILLRLKFDSAYLEHTQATHCSEKYIRLLFGSGRLHFLKSETQFHTIFIVNLFALRERKACNSVNYWKESRTLFKAPYIFFSRVSHLQVYKSVSWSVSLCLFTPLQRIKIRTHVVLVSCFLYHASLCTSHFILVNGWLQIIIFPPFAFLSSATYISTGKTSMFYNTEQKDERFSASFRIFLVHAYVK